MTVRFQVIALCLLSICSYRSFGEEYRLTDSWLRQETIQSGLLLSLNPYTALSEGIKAGTICFDSVILAPLVSEMLKDWRKDTNGCMGFRHSDRVSFLIKVLQIEGGTIDKAMEYFGTPNESRTEAMWIKGEDKDWIAYRYWVNVVCYGGAPMRGTDKCWLELLVDPVSKKVFSTSIPCQ
jgi:hypothetical protein